MLSNSPQWENQEISGVFHFYEKVIAICEHEIFGRRRHVVKTLQHTQSSPLDSFVDLNEGDYVVHVNYGVGQFVKIDRVSSFDRERDFIKIEYAGSEMLYVPIEQANLVQRYIGSEKGVPVWILSVARVGRTRRKGARAPRPAKHHHLYEKKEQCRYAFPRIPTGNAVELPSFDETHQLTCIEGSGGHGEAYGDESLGLRHVVWR